MQTKPSGSDPDLLKTGMVPVATNFNGRIVDKCRNPSPSLHFDPPPKPPLTDLVMPFVHFARTVRSPCPAPFVPCTAIRRAYSCMSCRFDLKGRNRSRHDPRDSNRLDSYDGHRTLDYYWLRWSDQCCHFCFQFCYNDTAGLIVRPRHRLL